MSWLQRLRLGWHAVCGRPAARLAYAEVLAADGEHARAFDQFARAARGGLADAQFRLGRCYLLGLGVPSCPDAALRWLAQAAERDQVEAQALLASLALQGISGGETAGLLEDAGRYAGRPPDYRAALAWGTRAADGGSAEAQALLGYLLTAGPEDMRDAPRAAHYYRLAAESGFAQGQLGWALALLRDDGAQGTASQGTASQGTASQGNTAAGTSSEGTGPKAAAADIAASDGGSGTHDTSAEVHRLLEAAAQADLPAAHFALGVLAEQADAVAEQLAAAAAHYREAAERGHRSAQFRYGMALLNGRGVERDTLTGETWLRRAGLAGDPQAAAMVGDLYAHRGGVPPNFYEAAMWFQRAAEAGHIGAGRALGQLYLPGGGITTDPVTAVHWLRVAATGGDIVAAYELGICLAHGIGAPRDDAAALRWLQQAAEALPAARYWYGRMLDEARGIARDEPAARACYLRAAAEGNGDAAVAAGEMLVNGRGGPPDRAAAMALFNHAAVQGHKGAQYALQVLEPADGVGPA